MKTLANRWIAWWLAVPAGDAVRRRRGRLLAIILAAALVGLVALTTVDLGIWLGSGPSEYRGYLLIDFLVAILCLGLWWLNRTGHTSLAGHIFITLAVLACSVGFDPRLIDRSMILYAVPILAASFTIRPRSSLLAALLATLGYTSAYLRSGNALEYNYAAVIGMFVLALLTWLAAHTLETRIVELDRAEARHRTTLRSIGDAVIATDAAGRVTLVNPVAEALIGWISQEALGKPLSQILRLVQETTHHPVEDPVARALRDGTIVGLGNHTLLIARDGSEHPIADSAAPIHDEAGHVTGVVMVFRDQTSERAAQEALRASEERYRQLAESTDAIWWEHDVLTDRLTYLAPQVERVLGYRPEEWAGPEFWAERLHPDDREQTRCLSSDRIAAGQPHDLEYRFRRKDGEYVWLRDVMSPELRDGRAVILRGFMLDITERRQAEEALRQREQELARLVSNLPGFIYRCANDRDWTMAFVSQGCRAITGHAPEDFIHNKALSYNDIVHPDYRERLWMEWQTILSRQGVFESEYPILHADGSTRWVWERGRGIFDERGQLLFLEGFITDVTARRQAEEALRRERELLRTVIDSVPDPIYIKDTHGRKTLTNRADARIMGFESEADLLGKTDLEVFPPEFGELYYASDLSVLAGEAIVNHEVVSATPSGQRRWFLISKLPLYDEQKRIIGLVGTTHDITALKENEEERKRLQDQLAQAQKMEAVGRLAGGVAHDFNNMLSVILGHAELALMDTDSAHPLYADLTEIQTAAQRSADLTRQLLAFARRQTVAPKVLDLNDTVTPMLSMLRRLVGEDVQVTWLPGAHLWLVHIDPSQIDQILANLCVNARAAIAGVGEVTIATCNIVIDATYCATHAEAAPGEYVILAVSDTGSGMGPNVIEHLFEPFFTTKPVGEGTGLGLATVHGIVRQNDGFISVESELGYGTTFRVHLPRHHAQAGPVAAEVTPDAPHGQGETILLVEDEPAILRLAQTQLARLGYVVLVTSAPHEAIELAMRRPGRIDLLITDVVMPEMNGHELAERLSALRPGVKCLFISGYTADVIAHQGLLNADVLLLQKPFTAADLAVKVREALSQS